MTLKAKLLCLLLASTSMHTWAAESGTSNDKVNSLVLDKLVQMGDYLRSLNKFQVNAKFDHDVVLESGLKIKTLGKSQMKVDGKNRLYAFVDSDAQTREYFYNGKRLTQYSPPLKYYTTVDAPDNISDTLHQIEKYYGLQLPMEDLFLFGRDQAQLDSIKEALYIGPSVVDGKVCDHMAFRQDGVDWQLWVARSGNPLPCKLVITTTDDTSRPEYSAVYSWNLKPTFKAANFTFTPGKGDTSIPFKKISE